MTDEQIELLAGEEWQKAACFTPKDRAVISWATEITNNTAAGADGVFAELQQHFSSAEIVEITLAASLFNMLNRIKEALHVGTEPATTLASITGTLDVNLPALREHVLSMVAEVDRLIEQR